MWRLRVAEIVVLLVVETVATENTTYENTTQEALFISNETTTQIRQSSALRKQNTTFTSTARQAVTSNVMDVNASVLNLTTPNAGNITVSTAREHKAIAIKARKQADNSDQLFANRRKSSNPKKSSSSRSTSSESGDARAPADGASVHNPTSIEITTEEEKEKKRHKAPKSSNERRGWRKWHRKCSTCPDDQYKKWRDPEIRWICGGYQRARRSFKSICMMRYRNCQDGTMFVFIHSNRCKDDNGKEERPYGRHFLYDYSVSKMEGDDTSKSDVSKSSKPVASSDDSSISKN